MNGTRVKCLLVLTTLSIIGFGPLSLTCLIGLYVVATRPRWFHEVVQDLYRNPAAPPQTDPVPASERSKGSTAARLKCFFSLIALLLLDIAPVPVTGSIGLYVAIMRPGWFKALVEKIYLGAGERTA